MTKTKHTKPTPIQNIKHLVSKGRINFNPIYQRGFIWKKPQKELFIDSLMLGYDIPKIYFHENKNSESGSKYDVVDGQQRLRTIMEFLENKVKLPIESDPVDGEEVQGRSFNDLSDDLQMEILNISLDIVYLNSEYNQDDIEDMFLRYQNGEPLNAAEKRKAITGNFKDVVKGLALHNIFKYCAFDNKRDGYQDAVAKCLHVRMAGHFTSITPATIKKTYLDNLRISKKHPDVADIRKTYKFIVDGFKQSDNPDYKIKKYAILTLTEVVHYLRNNYTVANDHYQRSVINAYLKFEKNRTELNELEDAIDSELSHFTDAARGDSPAQQTLRYNILLNFILSEMPDMTTIDPKRSFTEEQRHAIFYRDKATCKSCKSKIKWDNYHADHIIPHSKGGLTSINNGQVLCISCNVKKSNKVE